MLASADRVEPTVSTGPKRSRRGSRPGSNGLWLSVHCLPFQVELDRLLYARVDLIAGLDGHPVLLELELTEPSLYLGHADGAPERFADAIVASLR